MPAQSLIAVTVRRQQAWWHRRVTRGIEERPVAALDLNGQIMVPYQRGVEALAEVVAGNRRRRVRERVADQLELALQQHEIDLDEVALDEDADQQAKQQQDRRRDAGEQERQPGGQGSAGKRDHAGASRT